MSSIPLVLSLVLAAVRSTGRKTDQSPAVGVLVLGKGRTTDEGFLRGSDKTGTGSPPLSENLTISEQNESACPRFARAT